MKNERYSELITGVAFFFSSSPLFSSSFCLSASDDTLSGDDDIDFPGPEDIFFSSSDASEEDIVRFRSIMRGGRRLSRFTYFFVGSVLALMDAVVAR